jgi:hypothetical protein
LATTDLWKPLARSHCGSQANLQSHRKLEELNFLQKKKQDYNYIKKR